MNMNEGVDACTSGLVHGNAGQENYDDLGAAVTAWTKASLATIGGLCPVTVDKKATAYVSPAGVGAGVDPATPRLLLVHGSMPGGSCGIWGRSLCINVSTLEGAMFDYIRRAHERAYSTAFFFFASLVECDCLDLPLLRLRVRPVAPPSVAGRWDI